MDLLPRVLFVLGVGFLLANLRSAVSVHPFPAARSSALLTWPGRRPPFYGLLLVLGAILSLLILYKLAVLRQHPQQVFGEIHDAASTTRTRCRSASRSAGVSTRTASGRMAASCRYSSIGGLTWREGDQVTLVMMHRMRAFARRLVVPDSYYGAARRLLRDKIAAHDIHFTGKTLDLGLHDERDDV